MMIEYQIVKGGVVIGRFGTSPDRDNAFDKYCNDINSSYIKKEGEL